MLRDDEFDLVVRTVLGEAASESPMGQAAVAHVIRNRLQSGQFGKNARDVLFAPKQFEPWGSRRAELMAYAPADPKVQRAAAITQAVFDDRLPDPTEGATHFYGPRSQAALGRAPPKWDDGTGRDIGGHRFFKFAAGPGSNTSAKVSSAAAGVDVGDTRMAMARPGADTNAFPTDLEPIDDVQIASGADQKPPNAVPPSNPSSPVPTDLEPITDSFEDRFAGSGAGERKQLQTGLEAEAAARGAPSRTRSGVLGFGQGVTANWLDEAASGVNAAVDYATGQAPDGIGAAYGKRLASARQQLGEAERANPGTFLGSQVAGGLATAPLLPVKGPAMAGALYGAIGGAGAGEGASGAAAGAGLGAIGGAAIGAAAPHVIRGIGAAAGAAGRAVASPFRKVAAPGAEAQAKVSQALRRDARGGNTLDDETIDAAMEAGQPIRLMDVGGETTRSLARAAANTSPEARQTIQDVASDRFENQGSRIIDYVRSLSSGGANATRTREELVELARKENKVNYDIAERRGARGIWDDTLERLAQAPAVQQAIKYATRRGANRAAAEGRDVVTNPFIVDDEGVRLINPSLPPNLRFWDQVQRDLRDDADRLLREGAKSEAGDLFTLRKQLLGHLDERVPEFKVARAGAAAAFGEESALEVGEKLAINKMPLPEIRRNVAKMTPAERELLAEGYASAAVDRMKNTGERRNAVNALFRNPADREKAEIALGKGRAGELEAFLRRENIMDAVRGAMGNSTTARQFVELGAWNVGGISSYMSGDPKALSIGVIGSVLTRGNNALNQRVAKRVAELLVSDNPDLLRKATNTIARNARVARAVRDAEDTIIRATAPAATSSAPQQGPLQFDMNGPR